MNDSLSVIYGRWLAAQRARKRRLLAAIEEDRAHYDSVEAEFAARLGWFVGAGASPREAAFLNDVLRRELVDLRLDYPYQYDGGLVGGRHKAASLRRRPPVRVRHLRRLTDREVA